jgi:hypothetical protein
MNPGLGVDSCQAVFTGLRRKYGESFLRAILFVQCSVALASCARILPTHPARLESARDSIHSLPSARLSNVQEAAIFGAFWSTARLFVRSRTRDPASTLRSVQALSVTAIRLRQCWSRKRVRKIAFLN